MANLDYERQWPHLVVAGVDEVGRGALAGPVFAAAVILPLNMETEAPELLDSIGDSKTLSAKKRQKIYFELMNMGVMASLGAASCREIAQYNIYRATMGAMQRAIWGLPELPGMVLVDGDSIPDLPGMEAQNIVGGDKKCASISAASIVAKVVRDALMAKLAKRYPDYGWERNAGYGTKLHYDGISNSGITRHHRTGFNLNGSGWGRR